MCSNIVFLFLNKIYNTYRDLHTRIMLNNLFKKNCVCLRPHGRSEKKKLHYFQFFIDFIFADPDSSDTSRLYPNERY